MSFANPAAFWCLLGLLGLPAVLAIHFLQRRRRREVVTTLFLLQQMRRHGASHVAHTDDRHIQRSLHRLSSPGSHHDCTRRFALAMDIRIPKPMPSVTMAVPP